MNIMAIAVASIAEFIVGAIWYMPLFGKQWGEIHGFNDLSKKEQKELQAKMGPFYGLQLLVTVLTTAMLAKLILVLPDYSPYLLALLAWAGFVVPTQVSAVVFGGTKFEYIAKKIIIMSLGTLACLLVAAFILQLF